MSKDTGETQEKIQERKPCDYGGGDWSEAAAGQGTPGTLRSWKRQEGFFPRGFGGAEVHLIRLLASGTLREYISVGLSLP